MGGSIEDDSTDEAEIEKVANQIADVFKGIPYVQCSKLFPRKLQI